MGIKDIVADVARGLFKGDRPDGTLIDGVPPYRRLMAHIMPTRNESVVYFDTYARADELVRYLKLANERFPADITHALVAAGAIGLSENPKMNRFVAGRRLYQRNGSFITFSMKRQKLGREAKLAAVKMEMRGGETFRDLCERVNENVTVERSGKKTAADKEFDLFDKLPRVALDAAVNAFKAFDYLNVLPRFFIDSDSMYTSMFVANLGSLNMGAGFHHLYEWGTCPLFMMAGKLEERAIVENGEVVVRTVLPIRWSFDERVDDGLNARFGIDSCNRALENPFEYFGCLQDDGSDAVPLSRPVLP